MPLQTMGAACVNPQQSDKYSCGIRSMPGWPRMKGEGQAGGRSCKTLKTISIVDFCPKGHREPLNRVLSQSSILKYHSSLLIDRYFLVIRSMSLTSKLRPQSYMKNSKTLKKSDFSYFVNSINVTCNAIIIQMF